MEIRVILHLPNGDTVVTAYPMDQFDAALNHFRQYLAEGKRASLTNRNSWEI